VKEPPVPRNEGIVQHGGTIDAGALAVGRGARAVQRVEAAASTLDGPEVAARLRELTALLAAHAGELERPDDVLAAAETVAEELTRPEPSRVTLAGVLDGIAGAASGVGAIATAVAALRVAIGI
jgi:hypothetical protein